MNYREALSYLEYLQNFRIKLGLDRIRLLVKELGFPNREFLYVIIAGTNGKGSVGAFLSSVLSRRYRVGFNSSPHLITPRERIRINGEVLSQEKFAHYIGTVAEASAKINHLFPHPLTYFETLTAAAMLAFREEGVEIGIFEVGMGGRLDATNAYPADLSVITEIGLDHTGHLGKTEEEIAREKSFVIQRGVTVIGTSRENLQGIFLARAKEVGARARLVFTGNNFRRTAPGEFLYSGRETYRLKPALAGPHQGKNAATAVAAAEEISRLGYPIPRQDIEEGIASAFWPARLERIGNIYLDGMHNCHASYPVREFLEENPPWDTLIFGLLRDKDYRCMGRNIFPLFKNIVLTEAPSRRRMPAHQLVPLASRYGRIFLERNPERALETARRVSQGKILVAGSLYIVGKIREKLMEEGLVTRL